MRKYAVKNDVAASTSKGAKKATISKVAKSPVLKSTKAPSKGSSIKKTGARSSKKTDR